MVGRAIAVLMAAAAAAGCAAPAPRWSCGALPEARGVLLEEGAGPSGWRITLGGRDGVEFGDEVVALRGDRLVAVLRVVRVREDGADVRVKREDGRPLLRMEPREGDVVVWYR